MSEQSVRLKVEEVTPIFHGCNNGIKAFDCLKYSNNMLSIILKLINIYKPRLRESLYIYDEFINCKFDVVYKILP